MSRSLLQGVASGYVAIVVQGLVGLALAPYLLSNKGVGLAGFGAIATIQAVAFAISVLMDGHRQESARRIAHWTRIGERTSFGTLIGFTVSSAAFFSVTIAACAHLLIEFLGLTDTTSRVALQLALLGVVFEQYCYVLESGLHAARRSWVANMLGAGDACVRALLVVVFFARNGASVEAYFAATLLGIASKAVFLSIASRSLWQFVPMRWSRELTTEVGMFVRSLPLSLSGIAPYLVFRLSIILGSKFLGAQEAGVLGIMFVTLRTYLNQALFSALRPMLIARLASAELLDAKSAARPRFDAYLSLYGAAILAVGTIVICAAPAWVPLWLGDQLRPYVPLFMSIAAVYFLEMANGIPYYWLVAQGRAKTLALANGALALAACGFLLLYPGVRGDLATYVTIIAIYSVAYAGLVRHYFRASGGATRAIDRQLMLASVVCALSAWWILGQTRPAPEIFAIAAAAGALFLALYYPIAVPSARELLPLMRS